MPDTSCSSTNVSTSTRPPQLRWGILGTGIIAHTFARQLRQSLTGTLVAVGSRNSAKAEEFSKEFLPGNGSTITSHGSYDSLLSDPNVDVVYISTPHPTHADLCIRSAEAKKHILCEKPLTLTHADAVHVIEHARRHNVFLMEAFMYRCNPQTQKILEMIRSGQIGEVRVLNATFSYHTPAASNGTSYDPKHRLLNPELGGGGILDIGCYTTSIARLIAGAAQGLPFAEPVTLHGLGRIHPELGIDLYAIAAAEFPGGILAQLACGLAVRQEPGLRVFGTTGWLHTQHPFLGGHVNDVNTLFLHRDGHPVEEIKLPCERPIYALEADTVAEAIGQGQLECTAMPHNDTLGNMAMLDAWRAAVGVVYPGESGGRTDLTRGHGESNCY